MIRKILLYKSIKRNFKDVSVFRKLEESSDNEYYHSAKYVYRYEKRSRRLLKNMSYWNISLCIRDINLIRTSIENDLVNIGLENYKILADYFYSEMDKLKTYKKYTDN